MNERFKHFSAYFSAMDAYNDPLGFTKQTETLLRGLGARDLIKQIKRRNISCHVLHKLTKEDFMNLGADKQNAERLVAALSNTKGKDLEIKIKSHNRLFNKIEILKHGQRHLALIQAFLAYCKFRLKTERINHFVDPDKALSASQVLCIAADAILMEVNETEEKLNELEAVIITTENSAKYSKLIYCLPVTGIGIAAICILLGRFWK